VRADGHRGRRITPPRPGNARGGVEPMGALAFLVLWREPDFLSWQNFLRGSSFLGSEALRPFLLLRRTFVCRFCSVAWVSLTEFPRIRASFVRIARGRKCHCPIAATSEYGGYTKTSCRPKVLQAAHRCGRDLGTRLWVSLQGRRGGNRPELNATHNSARGKTPPRGRIS